MIMLRAYVTVSSERAIGMSIGPVPWSAMLRWCRWHELDFGATNHLVAVLQHVDAETLRREAARLRAQSKRE